MQEIRCKHIRIILLFLVASGLPVSSLAQINKDRSLYHLEDSLYNGETASINEAKLSPLSFNTTLGSSVFFAPGYGAGSNIFAAPHVDYSVTNRLSLHGGIIASQNFPLYSSLREDAGSLKSFTNLSMFVAASYRVTKDLVVYGTGIRSMVNPGISKPGNNFSMDDYSIGASYSFGNFTIGASFHSGYSNSFGVSPFNSARGIYPSPYFR